MYKRTLTRKSYGVSPHSLGHSAERRGAFADPMPNFVGARAATSQQRTQALSYRRAARQTSLVVEVALVRNAALAPRALRLRQTLPVSPFQGLSF